MPESDLAIPTNPKMAINRAQNWHRSPTGDRDRAGEFGLGPSDASEGLVLAGMRQRGPTADSSFGGKPAAREADEDTAHSRATFWRERACRQGIPAAVSRSDEDCRTATCVRRAWRTSEGDLGVALHRLRLEPGQITLVSCRIDRLAVGRVTDRLGRRRASLQPSAASCEVSSSASPRPEPPPSGSPTASLSTNYFIRGECESMGRGRGERHKT